MRISSAFLLPAALVVAASCSSSTGSAPAPAAAPTPAPAAAPPARGAAPAAAQAGGRGAAPAGAPAAGGQAPGGGRGGQPQMTAEQRAARRDSIGALRAATVKELMAKIAGRENEPAGTVFKNVQLMKTVTAGQLLTTMDQGMGRALSINCDGCHLMTDYASDSLPRKARARIMLNMVNAINTDPSLLSKMGPGRGGAPRTVQCVTCHRGGSAASTALVP